MSEIHKVWSDVRLFVRLVSVQAVSKVSMRVLSKNIPKNEQRVMQNMMSQVQQILTHAVLQVRRRGMKHRTGSERSGIFCIRRQNGMNGHPEFGIHFSASPPGLQTGPVFVLIFLLSR